MSDLATELQAGLEQRKRVFKRVDSVVFEARERLLCDFAGAPVEERGEISLALKELRRLRQLEAERAGVELCRHCACADEECDCPDEENDEEEEFSIQRVDHGC